MIINKEYISIELEYGNGRAELEAFPYDGALGPIFFKWHCQPRSICDGSTAAVKYFDESWDEFFARQDSDWEFTPLMRELAAILEKEWVKRAS